MIDQSIANNILEVQKLISNACAKVKRSKDEVTVIAVSKTVNEDAIESAFNAGINNFGENRVQEAKEKIYQLANIHPTWHMIGHLQTNKVKMALAIFDIIHSVDSINLANEIDRYADKTIPILLQVNVSGEATKNGFSINDISPAVQEIGKLKNLKIVGLMTIAPLVSNPEQVRPIFRKLKELRDYFGLEHLSMGMTDDYEIAIEEGATMVRIGRAIFGERL